MTAPSGAGPQRLVARRPPPAPGLLALARDAAFDLAAHAEARWIERLPGDPPGLRPEAMARRGWVVAPVESELAGEAAERLAAACARHGLARAWAVEATLGRPGGPATPPEAYRSVPLAGPALTALRSGTMVGLPYLLVEEDREAFAVATDGDYYWALGGPRVFVEEAVGASLAEALARFGEAAAGYAASPRDPVGPALARLLAVAARLAEAAHATNAAR